MNDPRPPREQAAARGAAGAAVRHDSAHLHVSGEAAYTDDILEARGTLHAAFGLSRRAHARIGLMDLSGVRAAPGVLAVLTAADIPGENNVGPILHDVAMGLLVCIATLAALEWPRARFALAAPAVWLVLASRNAGDRLAAAAELSAGALLFVLALVPSTRLVTRSSRAGRAGARA